MVHTYGVVGLATLGTKMTNGPKPAK